MERLKIAQYIAGGATLVTMLGLCLLLVWEINFGSTLMAVGVFAGIVSYCFGGFGKAISMSANIAKWGWIIVPFPIDLVTFVFAFFIAIFAFLFLPIIPVRKAYKESLYY